MRSITLIIFLTLSLFVSNQISAQVQFKMGGSTKWEITERSIVPYQSNKGIFIGQNAGMSETNSAQHSIGIGNEALKNNQMSRYNIGIGEEALMNSGVGAQHPTNDGAWNVALGYLAGRDNTVGDKNTFLGAITGTQNTIGRLNTAVGYGAMYNNGSGSSNTAFGASALGGNTSGNNNTAIGFNSMSSNTTGYANVAVGFGVLGEATTAHSNSIVGFFAGNSITTGSNNVGLGLNAHRNLTTGEENTSLGANTGMKDDASRNTAIGYHAMQVASGNDNVAVGHKALHSLTLGHANIAIGKDALSFNTTTSGLVAIGFEALRVFNPSSNTPSSMAIGYQASKHLTNQLRTMAIGAYALTNNIDSDNQAIGHNAMAAHNNGEDNTAIGNSALQYVPSNGARTAIGHDAGWFDAGNYLTSVCIGYRSSNTASYQVRLGNASTQNIGGYAPWSNLSDGRFKKDVAENVVGLDFINKLRPVTYHLDQKGIESFLPGFSKSDGTYARYEGWYGNQEIKMSGFVAQEVEAAAASVNYDFYGLAKPESENDHYSLRYAIFTVPLVKAVQELSGENTDLRNQLAKTQQTVEALAAEVQELKKLMTESLKSAK